MVFAKVAGGIEANLETEFEPELEPEPLLVRVRPFDLEGYHPQKHNLLDCGIRCFSDFILGVQEDLLLRESTSHLLSVAVEVYALFSSIPTCLYLHFLHCIF